MKRTSHTETLMVVEYRKPFGTTSPEGWREPARALAGFAAGVRALCAMAGLLAGAESLAADWTVTGTVKVAHQLDRLRDRYGTTSPLAHIEVKVSGRSRVLGVWGTWNSWGTDWTSGSGGFSVAETTGSGMRQIKVEVRLRNNLLTIRDAEVGIDSAPWYRIYQGEHSSGTIALGSLTFAAGGAADLGGGEAREQADYWVLCSLLMETLEDFGYPFLGGVVVEHGWHNPSGSGASYCDPWTGHVHINHSDFSTYTVIHEVMHRWFYDHFDDEGALTWQVAEHLWRNQTHCLQDDGESWVAFVEGFAEFCEDKLPELLFGDEAKVPFNRNWLNGGVDWEGCGDVLDSLDLVERHCAGWVSLFRLVTTPDIARYDFNAGGGRTVRSASPVRVRLDPDLGLEAVLNAITGRDRNGVIERREMNFGDFLQRVMDTNAGELSLTRGARDAWLELLDPAADAQPWELFPIDSGTVTIP